MDESSQPSSRINDGNEQTDQPLDEPIHASSITVAKKVLIAWLSAAAAAASLATATAMHFRTQGALARMETANSQEKQAALKQYDELRESYARMVAERRCEVIDGLDDCLAAGLTRPARFSATDRQLLDARRAAEPQHPGGETAPIAKPAANAEAKTETKAETKAEVKTETKAEQGESTPKESAPLPSAANGKIGMGEFVQELKKIPGVAIEASDSMKVEPAAEGKKRKKTSSKSAS